MFCTNCGKENSENATFCAHCGTSINKPQPETVTIDNTYGKIGGWLYVVALGLFISPFLLAYGVMDSLSLVLDGTLVYVDEEIPGMSLLIWFEIILDSVMILASIYLIFLFATKRREFPKYYIWFLVTSMVYLFADYIMAASLTSTNPEMTAILDETLVEQVSSITGSLIGSVIWIWYMVKSKRVASTFVK